MAPATTRRFLPISRITRSASVMPNSLRPDGVLRTTASAATTTATQTSQGNATASSGSTRPAADRTATARSASRIAWTTAAIRIGGGKRPGNAPPIA